MSDWFPIIAAIALTAFATMVIAALLISANLL